MVTNPRLTMHDGTILEKSECGYAEHKLWCWIKDKSLVEAFAVFSDPSKISTILFEYGTQKILYKGFTDIEIIRKSEFTIDICLTGENTEIIENSDSI